MNKKSSRGFYIALYSCIAAILITAVAITYNSISSLQRSESESHAEMDLSNMVETSLRITPSAIVDSQDDMVMVDGSDVAFPNIFNRGPRESEPPTEPQQGPAVEPEDSGQESGEAFVEDEETAFVSNIITTEPVVEILADPVFSVFNGDADMTWPVEGTIVMDFSIDRVIYDVTLEQFRTNDSISIAATPGTQVRAAADGVVVSVRNTRIEGNTVVIEHGNGWHTTYSQLQDGILVAEGDVVVAGQIIGGVSNPSAHSSLLGSHLNFRVTRDESPVNPMLVLR
ncbi:MAG: M23 family metallopeptidase [Defluviitaleaceae bacterium]|nr:M23 family metallopeptidase [Defluviitaleaceae bacterium]